MKLELVTFPVKDVRFGRRTNYSNGVLEVDKQELLSLILEDKRVTSAEIHVAFPGEQTRIVNTCDVVEPRVKVSGPGCVFPGILGPVETVGEGRTHRLSGVTVIPCAEYQPTVVSGPTAHKGGLVDMWGPGSLVTPFGSTINFALVFKLVDPVSELEAESAIQLAEFKVARRLAETTKKMTSNDTEAFELFEVDPSLPRVVYVLGCVTQWHAPHSGVAYYGAPIRESMPFFVHPNELLDGALTPDARRGSATWPITWLYLNQPMVLGLLRAHGKRINFLGVIVQRTRFETDFGKQVSGACTAQMAKLLRADCAVITRISPAGSNFIDVMVTLQAIEKKGIKTVLVTPEAGGANGDELPLIFYVPEATAVVSTGSHDRAFKLPAPTKVIGCDGESVVLQPGTAPLYPRKALIAAEHEIPGSFDWYGGMNFTCKGY